TGRFMQTDPFVQAPSNLQNYNRYSYVLNNPLSFTDPSGYIFKPLKKVRRNLIRAHAKVYGPEVTNTLGNLASAACGGAVGICSAFWNYEFTRAMGGSSSQAFKAGI
ncbi:RHS repeat-associated core domain-containing protein, partial [Pseudoalteromonas luteoviolacea]